MIFQCSDLERALGSPELMRDARAHAGRCPRCSEQLYLWDEMSRLAPQLHEEWESPELWGRIRAELKAEAPARKPLPVWRWALAAAAMVTLAVAMLQPWKSGRSQTPDFLTDGALREVEQAETAYARSIEKLSAIAGPGLQQSPSPLAAAYREKLLVLDSAIADLKTSVGGNRYNVYLQNQLASLYVEKQKTLEEWLKNAKRN